jgi:hypothetical protein
VISAELAINSGRVEGKFSNPEYIIMVTRHTQEERTPLALNQIFHSMCSGRAALIEVIVANRPATILDTASPYIHASFNAPSLARELFYLLKVAQTKMSFGLLLTDSLPHKDAKILVM